MTMALTQVSDNGLTNTGVTAATYGSSSAIPSLTIDAKGRVTSATTSAIDSTSIANGTSNVSVMNNGEIIVTRASQQKLATKSDGIDVTGEVQCDSLDVDGGADIAGGLTVDRVVIRDNGSVSPLLALRADDGSPWALNIGNDTYSNLHGVGLQFYQSNDGSAVQQLAGNSAWENFYLQQVNGGATETAIHIDTNRSVNIKYRGNTKLQTISSGVDITGEVQCDSLDVDGNADIDGELSVNRAVLRDNNANSPTLQVRTDDTSPWAIAVGNDTYNTTTTVGWLLYQANDGGVHNYIRGNSEFVNYYIKQDNNSGTVNIGIHLDTNRAVHLNHQGNTRLSTKSDGVKITGHCEPAANNTYDLGTSSLRWRNLYTNDLNLSNEGSINDVDGTWGSYTIQEGEDDLFLINRRSGKKYKFNLTEVH